MHASRGPPHGYTEGTEYPVALPGEGFEGHHHGHFGDHLGGLN